MVMPEHDMLPCLGVACLMGITHDPLGSRTCARYAIESRKNHRVPLTFHVHYRVDGTQYSSITHNICYGGLFIETGKTHIPGQRISLKLESGPVWGSFRMKGEIVRNSPHGIGVRLIRDCATGF
jgi:hypothetical protein